MKDFNYSDSEYEPCLIKCKEVGQICLSTFKQYIDREDNIDKDIVAILLECSRICEFVSDMIILNSDYIELYLDLCTFICEECIEECEDLEQEYFKKCIIVCDECIDQCKDFIHE